MFCYAPRDLNAAVERERKRIDDLFGTSDSFRVERLGSFRAASEHISRLVKENEALVKMTIENFSSCIVPGKEHFLKGRKFEPFVQTICRKYGATKKGREEALEFRRKNCIYQYTV